MRVTAEADLVCKASSSGVVVSIRGVGVCTEEGMEVSLG